MRISTLAKPALAACLVMASVSASNVSAQIGSRLFGGKKPPTATSQPREVQGPALQGATPVPAAGTGQPQSQAAPGQTTTGQAQPVALTDTMVFPSKSSLPEPLKPEDLPPTTIALPSTPIDGYLLTKDCGPFMVLAHTFRGPEAERYALALVLELRNSYNLPAYILRTKDMPGRSNIRNIPPTAPEYMRLPQQGMPEKVRTEDEAAVLVGNEKSLENSAILLKEVKKIHPKALEEIPSIWSHRKGKGLSRAIRTTNPYVPAQQLFSQKPDALIEQMNGGPHSVYHCPGKFSLQIAEFTGRTTFNTAGDKRFMGMLSLKSSPLATAHEDAEKLAAALARDKDVMSTGYQPSFGNYDLVPVIFVRSFFIFILNNFQFFNVLGFHFSRTRNRNAG